MRVRYIGIPNMLQTFFQSILHLQQRNTRRYFVPLLPLIGVKI